MTLIWSKIYWGDLSKRDDCPQGYWHEFTIILLTFLYIFLTLIVQTHRHTYANTFLATWFLFQVDVLLLPVFPVFFAPGILHLTGLAYTAKPETCLICRDHFRERYYVQMASVEFSKIFLKKMGNILVSFFFKTIWELDAWEITWCSKILV